MRTNLRLLRTSAGLTQREFADKVGVALTTYQTHENGTINPPLDTAVRYAQALQCSVNDIIPAEDTSVSRSAETVKGLDYREYIFNLVDLQTLKGVEKYGAVLSDYDDMHIIKRLEHWEQECADQLVYIQHAKREILKLLTIQSRLESKVEELKAENAKLRKQNV